MTTAPHKLRPIRRDHRTDKVSIIDQRLLPHELVVIDLETVADAERAIREMAVRGAPLIGVTAAYGLFLAARAYAGRGVDDDSLRQAARLLTDARPTAVNLAWAVARVLATTLAAPPAARPEAIARMARHGLRPRPGGGFERKTDPAFHQGARRMTEAEAEERERRVTQQLWEALARVPCPTLVVRGAASDVLSPDVAERMAEEVLPQGRLAVVARASHSVMTDNPEGFAEAVCAFVLGE